MTTPTSEELSAYLAVMTEMDMAYTRLTGNPPSGKEPWCYLDELEAGIAAVVRQVPGQPMNPEDATRTNNFHRTMQELFKDCDSVSGPKLEADLIRQSHLIRAARAAKTLVTCAPVTK